MAKFDQYRVEPKQFSLKNFKANDKSERGESKAQDALELTRLANEINALQDIIGVTRHGCQR